MKRTDLVPVKSTTKIGMWTVPFAVEQARQAREIELRQKNLMLDGFILRGVKVGKQYQAQILDTPSYVLFAGFAGFRGGLTPLGYGAMAVGGRDDVYRQGTSAVYSAETVSSFSLLQIPSVPAGAEPAQLVFFPPTQQAGSLVSAGYLATPILRTDIDVSFDPLDDMRFFTFAQDVVVGGGFTSIHDSGIPLRVTTEGAQEGTAPNNYLSRDRYFISESFLSDGWRLHSRRQVPHTEYNPAIDPEYAGRIGPGILQPGLATRAAEPVAGLVGVDQICVAARAFQQYLGTWYVVDEGPEYRPRFYDRYGYQGLLVSRGVYDRADYVPGTFADFTPAAEWIVTPEDLPSALRPFPTSTPPNDFGKPELPGFGQFLVPHVAWSDGGFVVFSVYTTFRNESGEDDPSPEDPLAGDVFALAVTIPDQTTRAYGQDWDAGAGVPLLPGAVVGYFSQGWILGACSVTVGADTLAAALVWEHQYGRKTAPPRGLGGQWVLYTSNAVTTTRTVLTGSVAPLIAAIMQREPTQFSQLPFDEDQENTLSMVHALGEGLLVTSCVATATPVVTDGVNIPPEQIRCAVIDLATGAVSQRGVITTRDKTYTKCLITVVQPYKPAAGGKPEQDAVLLASVTDHLIDNRGTNGAVYISVDGGDTWREYIEAAGAQGGAFFAGNRFWRYGVDRPLTTGGQP